MTTKSKTVDNTRPKRARSAVPAFPNTPITRSKAAQQPNAERFPEGISGALWTGSPSARMDTQSTSAANRLDKDPPIAKGIRQPVQRTSLHPTSRATSQHLHLASPEDEVAAGAESIRQAVQEAPVVYKPGLGQISINAQRKAEKAAQAKENAIKVTEARRVLFDHDDTPSREQGSSRDDPRHPAVQLGPSLSGGLPPVDPASPSYIAPPRVNRKTTKPTVKYVEVDGTPSNVLDDIEALPPILETREAVDTGSQPRPLTADQKEKGRAIPAGRSKENAPTTPAPRQKRSAAIASPTDSEDDLSDPAQSAFNDGSQYGGSTEKTPMKRMEIGQSYDDDRAVDAWEKAGADNRQESISDRDASRKRKRPEEEKRPDDVLAKHQRPNVGKGKNTNQLALFKGKKGIHNVRDVWPSEEPSDSSRSSDPLPKTKEQPNFDPLKILTYSPDSKKVFKLAKGLFVTFMNLEEPFPNEAKCIELSKKAFETAATQENERFKRATYQDFDHDRYRLISGTKSNGRQNMIDASVLLVVTQYDLKSHDNMLTPGQAITFTKARVMELLTSNHDYMRANFGKRSDGSPRQNVPFAHPAVLEVLKSGIYDRLKITERHRYYPVPIHLCAYAATAIYAALMFWKTGIYKRGAFTAEQYGPIYRTLLDVANSFQDGHKTKVRCQALLESYGAGLRNNESDDEELVISEDERLRACDTDDSGDADE